MLKKGNPMLLEVNTDDDEGQLKMMDGSKWFVNPGDLPTVCTWIPTTPLKIKEIKDGLMFSSKLTNTTDNISIRATRVI